MFRKRRKGEPMDGGLAEVEQKLTEAQTSRKEQERKRDQEKKSIVSRLVQVEERNDIGGLLDDIFGMG